MKKTWIAVALFFACLAAASPVFAGAKSQCPVEESLRIQEKTFKAVDRDSNQKISPDEFSRYIESTAFALMDKNGDAKIDIDEWRAVEKGPNNTEVFMKMDKNSDGGVSYEELVADPVKRQTIDNLFNTLDENADGVLDKQDLKEK